MYRITVLALLLCIGVSESYKILLVFPFPHMSHSILGHAFVKILLKAGHEVTYLTPAPLEESHPNLRQIKLLRYNFNGISIKSFIENHGDKRKYNEIFEVMMNITYSAVSNPDVQKLMMNSEESFDLVVVERMMNEVYSGFSAVFNCPYIWFFSFENTYDILRLIHETPNPAYTTNFRTNNVPPFSFLQRVQELLYVITSAAQRIFVTDLIESRVYTELFGPALIKRNRTLPPYDEVRYNASLLFSNSHVTIRYREETPQTYKAIGGFHITDSPEPLSEEYSKIMENSSGVILFSTGSYLKVEDLPLILKRKLLTTFSKLNYTVLWKIDEQFADFPNNVRTFSWIPNQSILAHPKCVLFITHGGMLSLIEAVHYGVPVIGVPVYADQEVNVKTLVKRGIARMVPMGMTLADDLKEAMEDVLGEPRFSFITDSICDRYKENAMKLSKIFHDRPVSPAQELQHWVEHVIATQGAPHLRSPALLMPWYQKFYVDFAAVSLISCIVFSFVLSWLSKYLSKKVKMVVLRFQDTGKFIKVS